MSLFDKLAERKKRKERYQKIYDEEYEKAKASEMAKLDARAEEVLRERAREKAHQKYGTTRAEKKKAFMDKLASAKESMDKTRDVLEKQFEDN